MTIPLHLIDLLLIGAYIVGILWLGLGAGPARGADTKGDFLLGGRRLTLFPFIATLVTTWYGGILGVGEFTYLNGIVNFVVFGLPYYLYAVIYARFIAGRISKEGAVTIPERIRRHYGPRSAIFSAGLVFLLATPAPYLLMLGVILNYTVGMPLNLAIVTGAIVSTIYLWRGGFGAVIRTDILQFALMFLGFGILLVHLLGEISLPDMWASLPHGHRLFRGAEGIGWQTILVWYLIASWTFIDPGFYQRCAAAKDGATAARGIMLSIPAWFIFDLLTTITGLYAVTLLPDLASSESGAVAAYPVLGAMYLPAGLRGLFFVGLLAVIMSTIDSFVFIGATTVGRDMPPPTSDGELERRRIQRGIVISGAVGLLLAILLPSVVDLWFTLGTLLVPGLLLPVLVTFIGRPKLSDKAALMVGLSGSLTAIVWYTGAMMLPATGPLLGIEPMIPGLILSTVTLLTLGDFDAAA